MGVFVLSKLTKPHIIKRIFLERLTEPLHLNLLSLLVMVGGTTRAKIAFDLIPRHHLAYSLLNAADQAKRLGISRLTAVEFGVAAGAGLLNMCELASRVTRITGVEFSLVGFDSGTGMPAPRDYRDHPEYFAQGDFPCDTDALARKLPPNARLCVGDVSRTVPDFVETITRDAPLGFVAIDVDYYWSTRECLTIFCGPPTCYLPITPVYLDDVEEEGMNPWCGEMLAVNEFNAQQRLRKISPLNFLRQRRIFRNAKWIDHMYALHVFDHPTRSRARAPERAVRLDNPYL